MKGLLLKDWYQIRTSMKTLYLAVALVLIIWMFSSSSSYEFPVSYTAIFLGILPVNLLTYDQGSGWVEYGRTLPVSKKTLVAEKYLVGLLCAAGAVVVGGLFVVALVLGKGMAVDGGSALLLIAGSVCSILLVNGVSLPLLYRFGAEKARMIYFLTFAGFGAMLGGGGAVLQEVQQESDGWPLEPPLWLVAVLLLAALALYAVSWRVSVAWYGKYKK